MISAFLLAILSTQISDIAPDAKGKVGAAVVLIEANKTISLHGSEHFPMQSVYKVPIAMAVLHEAGKGKLSLEQKVRIEESDILPPQFHSPIRDAHPHGGIELTVRELLRYSIAESDGMASDILLRLIGGPEVAQTYLRGIGINDIVIATTERAMADGDRVQYRNWATPLAAAKLLQFIHEGRGLSREGRELILKSMTDSTPGPKRIKGQLPAGTVVAHKTGTSLTRDGMTFATNDIGIITLPDGRHLVVAVFVSDSRADQDTREAVIARIAKAAYDWAIVTR